ncbi:Cytochrome c556 [Gemmobacter megaterium]|uniref:Cytochrome c556 n=1 Tax=Gemmobacter megaterium TaxID=1086013 RepID=A0A1N7M2F2_9RHOB|nr:cytochrome c [Gemmobacter megaterium]GGE09211.1 cytochrome C556 [Gemmobacter megaterium]SIS80280.1 Cytochrome c556 [Gemmobacter megaterium]
MKFLSKTVALCLIAAAGAAAAKDGVTNPVVKERMDLMQTIRVNTGTLGNMASGKEAFDPAAATAAKTALAAAAAEIVVKFQANEDDPVSEGSPKIWEDYAGFTTRAEALVTAAEAVDVASLDGLKAGMGAIGGSCQSCHEVYRVKK